MKYIVITNLKHDPNNSTVVTPIHSFLGGYTTFGTPDSDEGEAYFTEQLDRITRAAKAVNCRYIGYAFLEDHTHADIYRKLNHVGPIYSAGFIDRASKDDKNYRWITHGISRSLSVNSHPDDMIRFNGYFFDIGLNPDKPSSKLP
jgi:hypothetical protein